MYKQYGLPRMSALRATLRREITLIRRTSFIYIFRTFQVGWHCGHAILLVTISPASSPPAARPQCSHPAVYPQCPDSM